MVFFADHILILILRLYEVFLEKFYHYRQEFTAEANLRNGSIRRDSGPQAHCSR